MRNLFRVYFYTWKQGSNKNIFGGGEGAKSLSQILPGVILAFSRYKFNFGRLKNNFSDFLKVKWKQKTKQNKTGEKNKTKTITITKQNKNRNKIQNKTKTKQKQNKNKNKTSKKKCPQLVFPLTFSFSSFPISSFPHFLLHFPCFTFSFSSSSFLITWQKFSRKSLKRHCAPCPPPHVTPQPGKYVLRVCFESHFTRMISNLK